MALPFGGTSWGSRTSMLARPIGLSPASGRDFMRTLASTFSTRDEAEAACRHLEAIGIGRERIILKDVGQAANGAASAGSAFISVKVTREQVAPASEILKGHGRAEDTARQTSPQPELPPRPLPSIRAEPEAVAGPGKPQLAGIDRSRLGRYLIYYSLVLVAAFVIGAWLGMLS